MEYISLKSIPKLNFAHVYGAVDYKNDLAQAENTIELSYITQGSTEELQENAPSVIKRVGDVSCNLFHQKTPIRSHGWHEHHTVAFHVEFDYSREPKDGFFPILRHLPQNENSYKAHRLIDEIIQLSQSHETTELAVSGLFLQLLSVVSMMAQNESANEPYNMLFYVNKAKEYIFNNLQYPITQREVAAYLRITPEYLCNVFKAVTGETVVGFINRTKLRKIRSLIARENVKLYQAAEMYGYSDPNYVSRLYKKLFGQNITER